MKVILTRNLAMLVAVATTALTFLPGVMSGGYESCHYEGKETTHNQYYKGRTMTCKCNNGHWTECKDNHIPNPTSKPQPKPKPTYKPHPTSKPQPKPKPTYRPHPTSKPQPKPTPTYHPPSSSDDHKQCWWKNKSYTPNKWYGDDEEMCYCNEHGEWTHCTYHKKCWWKHKSYSTNTWQSDDERKCYCNEHGEWTHCTYHCKSIAELVCETDDLSILCESLKKTNLYETLDDVDAKYTVFAPSDEAFTRLLETLDPDPSIETLKDVLLLHVIAGQVLYKDDLKDQCWELSEMVNGDQTQTICMNDKQDIFQRGGGNSWKEKPEITAFDFKASNGIVHAVDEVLLPGTLQDPATNFVSMDTNI